MGKELLTLNRKGKPALALGGKILTKTSLLWIPIDLIQSLMPTSGRTFASKSVFSCSFVVEHA